MNPSVVLKTLFKPGAALTAVAGALMLCSCYVTPPPPPNQPFAPPGQPRFGYNGTSNPSYPQDARTTTPGKPTETPPKIVRDPRDTSVNITPPEPRTGSTGSTTPPPSTGNPVEPPTVTNPDPPKPPPTAVRDDLPYGIPVVGKKGMVYSPYAPEKGQVDVDGYKRGTKVECPYTGKHFRVP